MYSFSAGSFCKSILAGITVYRLVDEGFRIDYVNRFYFWQSYVDLYDWTGKVVEVSKLTPA